MSHGSRALGGRWTVCGGQRSALWRRMGGRWRFSSRAPLGSSSRIAERRPDGGPWRCGVGSYAGGGVFAATRARCIVPHIGGDVGRLALLALSNPGIEVGDEVSVPGDKALFARLRPALELALEPEGRAAIANLQPVDQLQRLATLEILGAAAGAVLGEATLHVGGDAGVEAAVPAADQVDRPAQSVAGARDTGSSVRR